ncbi:hypothetical protein BRO13_12940, partial [Xanthomonas oryzae pv. oryzae]
GEQAGTGTDAQQLKDVAAGVHDLELLGFRQRACTPVPLQRRATCRLRMRPMHDQFPMTIQRVRRMCIVRPHNSVAYVHVTLLR